MKIDILTIFPHMFDNFLSSSIIHRALDRGLVDINIIDFREFSKLPNHQVDDTPYGGGSGMVLRCEPIFEAVESIKRDNSLVIMLSPQGESFNQKMAEELKLESHLILLCGHYEGFDERIKAIVDKEISLGDFILTGGELPAMIMSDAITRLIPGVISDESIIDESFNDNLLDYPTYTKPAEFRGMMVPEVLLSGNHQKIAEYRHEQRIKKTMEKRPDLLK